MTLALVSPQGRCGSIRPLSTSPTPNHAIGDTTFSASEPPGYATPWFLPKHMRPPASSWPRSARCRIQPGEIFAEAHSDARDIFLGLLEPFLAGLCLPKERRPSLPGPPPLPSADRPWSIAANTHRCACLTGLMAVSNRRVRFPVMGASRVPFSCWNSYILSGVGTAASPVTFGPVA